MGIADSSELETELQKIADYILALRREIAVLQANEIHRSRIPAAGEELAAVVRSTEGATNEIMSIAEGVMAADSSNPESYKAFVEQEMLGIFEACAFQDLTGQRIARVVKTLEHIERRVSRFASYTRVEDQPGFATDDEARQAERNVELMLSGPGQFGEANLQPAIDSILERLKSTDA